MAAPTLDYLLQITRTHRQSLISDLTLNDEQLDQLDTSNRIYREKYTNGHYGYALQHATWTLQQNPELKALSKKRIAETPLQIVMHD